MSNSEDSESMASSTTNGNGNSNNNNSNNESVVLIHCPIREANVRAWFAAARQSEEVPSIGKMLAVYIDVNEPPDNNTENRHYVSELRRPDPGWWQQVRKSDEPPSLQMVLESAQDVMSYDNQPISPQYITKLLKWWDEVQTSDQPPVIPEDLLKYLEDVGGVAREVLLLGEFQMQLLTRGQFGKFAVLMKQLYVVCGFVKQLYVVCGFVGTVVQDAFCSFLHTISAGDNQPSEDDVWSILNAVAVTGADPRADFEDHLPTLEFLTDIGNFACENDYKWCDFDSVPKLRRILGYSGELLEILFRLTKWNIPAEVCNGSFYQRDLEIDSIALLRLVLPKCRLVGFSPYNSWREDILRESLLLLGLCSHMDWLELYAVEGASQSQVHALTTAISQIKQKQVCGIQCLQIREAEGHEEYHGDEESKVNSFCLFLEATRLMPKLHKLELKDVTSALWVPSLVNALKSGTITRLDIGIMYRAECADNDGNDWLPLFEFLKTDASLKEFDFTVDNSDSEKRPALCKAKLLEVLQQNSCLSYLYCSNMIPRKIVNFYTDLNRCGRSKARNPATTINEWVELLASVLQKHRGRDGDDVLTLNRIYGLIQESSSIARFFGDVCNHPSEKTKKRKRGMYESR